MTNPDLAALSAAASVPWEPRNGFYPAPLLPKARWAYLMALETEYRAGRLVQIDEGTREKADPAWQKWEREEGPAEAWDPQAIFDAGWDAASAAILGETP